MVLLPNTIANLQAPLPTPQVVLALVLAIGVFLVVVELVRRQKLREEYAFLWMGTAVVLVVLAVFVDILVWFAEIAQAESLISILFFGGLVFLMLVALQYSVRLTKLTYRNKTLTQRITLLEQRLEEVACRVESANQEPAVDPPPPETAPPETQPQDPVR